MQNDLPAEDGGCLLSAPRFAFLWSGHGGDAGDFIVAATEQDGLRAVAEAGAKFQQSPSAAGSLVEVAQNQPCDDGSNAAPEWPDGQLRQPEGPEDLGGQHQEDRPQKEEGVSLVVEDAADEAAQGTGGRPIGEVLLEAVGVQGDTGHMAQLVGQQLLAVVDEPALLPFEAAADDEEGEEVGEVIVGAAAEKETEGGAHGEHAGRPF